MKERRKKISVFTLMLGALLGMLFGFSMPTQAAAAYPYGTARLENSNSGDKALYSNVVYTVTTDTTIWGSASNNGYHLENKIATIYIKKGATLYVYGGNAAFSKPGKAGIKVNKDQRLIITGGGSLIVSGGAGGRGSNGTLSYSCHKHDGGAGGAGGAGGGAAIGTDGAKGGAGGSSRCIDKNGRGSGNDGKTGGTADPCGIIYVVGSVTRAVSSGSNGSGGGTVSTKDRGGSGGGGGGGQRAVALGTGGAGGGGGGGGGTGKNATGKDPAGGGGGAGSSWGSPASTGNRGNNSNVAYSGGSGGRLGTSSRTATIYTNTTYIPASQQITVSMDINIDESESTNTGTPEQTVSGTKEQNFIYGASAMSKIEIPKRLGYVFDGYYTQTGDKIYNADGSANSKYLQDKGYLDENDKWVCANDLTVYAKWVPVTAGITLNANGGSGTVTINQDYDKTINILNVKPKRVGYVFKGYYTQKTGGVQIFNENGEYQEYSEENGEKKEEHLTGVAKGSTYENMKGGKLSQFYKDTTLYAQWKPVEYTIQYYSWSDEEQGEVFIKEEKATYGSMTLLSDDDLGITRKHHTFSGWNNYVEQGWNMYKANHQYSGGLTEEDGGVVAIYAVWEPVGQITISYKAEGGKGVPADGVAYTGESDYAVPDTIPTRDNYTFVEWNTASDGKGTSYKAGDKITAGSSNITLYAIWKAHPALTYNLNGGSGYLPMEYHKAGEKVTLASGTEKEGCTLRGWKTKDSDTVLPLDEEYDMPDKNVVLYAVWDVKNLTVKAESVKDTEEEAVPEEAISVVGWNSDADAEEALKSSVKYNEAYAFAVKADDHYDTSKMSVSVSGNPAVRSKKIASTGANAGYTYYVYKVNNPRADQIISVSDVSVKTYFVNLVTNGGDCIPLTSYSYGKETELPVPAKDGNIFEGWYTDKECKKEAAKNDKVYVISKTDDGDKTFYARWQAISYTVVYDANGGTFTEEVAEDAKQQKFVYDETKKLTVFNKETELTQPADVKENGFLGWATDEYADVPEYVDGQYVTNLTTDADSTVTLYAVWDIEKHNISYNLNGGTIETGLDIVSVNKGKRYTCYNRDSLPTKTGYTFAGWSDGRNTYTEEKPSFTVGDGDVELTAQWTPVTYKVEFNSNGGSGESQIQEFTYDEAQAFTGIAELGFKNTAEASTEGAAAFDYSFYGWATDKNATKPEYVDAQSVMNLTSKQDKQIELYAVWKTENKQYVSYDANGGQWKKVPAAEEVTEERVSLSFDFENVLERTGYTFAGWADTADATEADYREGSAEKTGITESTTVYAVWKSSEYTVKFDKNSEDAKGTMAELKVSYDETVPLTKNSFTRDGYVFAGWAAEGDGKAIYRDEQEVKNLTAGADTITLYAVWKAENVSTVFFDTTGGKRIEPVSVTTNSELSLKAEDGTYNPLPEREGYTFAGWATTPDAQKADVEDSITVAGNTVLYAVWQSRAASTVTYKVDGEEYPLDTNTYYEGDKITVNFDYIPSKTGYIFKGWECGDTTYTEQSEEKAVVAGKDDLVFEAVWAPIVYTVTFDANNENAALKVNKILADYGISIRLPEINTEGSDKNATAPEGYSFVGWSTQKGSTIVDYKAGEKTESLSEQNGATVTLYAVWKPESHVITIDNQLEDTKTTTVDVTYGQVLPTLTILPSRKNYTFEGYFTEKDGKGTQYYDGNLSPMIEKCELKEDITLYAGWSADKYRIVYQDANGVELKAYQAEFKSNVMIQTAKTVGLEVKDGYKVVWQKDGNDESQYQVGDTVEGGFFKDGEDIGTVYLRASIRQDTQHEVSYNANGGGFKNIPKADLVWDGEKTSVQFNNLPTRDGYEFIGWTTTLSGKTVNYYTDTYKEENGISTIENERIFRVERGTVLYAMWKPGEYTITYNANGGKLKPSAGSVNQYLVRGIYEVSDGKTPITLFGNIFSREGYTFEGWATSSKGSAQYEAGEAIQTDIAPATRSGITLYAVWTANTYTVDFKDQDGSEIADEMEVTYGKSYGNLPSVTKTGYTFAGWYKGSYQNIQSPQSGEKNSAETTLVLGEKVKASTKVTDTASHALYAVWTPNTNTAYTVKHYKQQLDKSYTQSDLDQLTGTTGKETEAAAREYKGFKAQTFSQTTIEADGSTVVKIYYNREYMSITYPEDTSDNVGMNFEGDDFVLYDGTYTFKVTVAEGYDANTLNVQVNDIPVYGSSKKNEDGTVTVTYTVRNAIEVQKITADVQPVVTDTFNANGGIFADGKAITTYSGNSGDVIEFKAPEREGYRFAGWAEDAYAKTGSSTVKFKGGITYYAVWEHDENIYVKFNAENAVINGAHSIAVSPKGEHVGTLYDVELPTAVYNDSKEVNHHEFKHWALENKYDATKVTKDLKFKENSDVYAIWTYVIGATGDGSSVIIDDDFKLNEDGSVTGNGIGKDNKLNIIMKDAEGREATTEIKLPEGNDYTVAKDGTIHLTGEGNTITRPDGDKITTNGAATVTTDGTIILTEEGSSVIIKKANGEEITVESKDSTIKADETITSKKPITVKKDNQTNIIIPGNATDSITGIDADGKVNPGNATVTPKGDYTIGSDNAVSLGEAGGKVTLPNGKEADINGDAKVSGDGNITAPKGTTVVVDNKEIEGPAAVSKEGMTAEVEPAGTDGKGKITGVDQDTQYSTDDGNSWKTAQPDGNGGYIIPDVSGDVIIRNGEDDNTRTTISIGTKDAPVPIKTDNIKADKATSADAKDSRITGVDSSMEYSTDGGKTWNDVTGNEITGLGSGEVLIRTKETRTEVEGEVTTITIAVKTTPAPIEAGTIKSTKATTVNTRDATLTGVDSSMEYSIDGGKTWTQVTENTIGNLGAGEVQIRVKETEDANPSEAIKVIIGVKTTAASIESGRITATKTTTANARDAKILGVDSSMEYSTDGGKTWTQVTGKTIGNLGTGEVQIRVKGTDDTNPSAVTKVTITVKDRTNAPSAAGIKVSDADSKKTSNAAITGVNSSMEYSKDGGRTWTRVTGNRIAGLGVGKVQIRYAESDTKKASAATTVTIGMKAPDRTQKHKNELALNGGLKVSQSGKVITIKWGKVAEADGYDVYVQYCGKKFKKPAATVASGRISSVRVKKINGKKLNLKANYKVYVSAYTVVNGKKINLCKSIQGHVVGAKNKKFSNARNIKVSKKKITLKKRKSTTIKAKIILVNRRKKQLSNKHARQFRYATSNAEIAKVSKRGRITARKKGTCTIYVYARNGFAKKIKVTVK